MRAGKPRSRILTGDVYKRQDDGWSGTNFNRPAFKQMMEDIETKKINCVITKDLSRLGRDHVMVGYYTETFFPEHGIRYIAINDRVDSNEGDSDIAPFMNVFNEFHAKQDVYKRQLLRLPKVRGRVPGEAGSLALADA